MKKMQEFTDERDNACDRDVEGQLLAKTLGRIRETFGASSLEYEGIRKMLVLGLTAEELEARAQTLEEGVNKYPTDSPEYQAYREKCLYMDPEAVASYSYGGT